MERPCFEWIKTKLLKPPWLYFEHLESWMTGIRMIFEMPKLKNLHDSNLEVRISTYALQYSKIVLFAIDGSGVGFITK